MSKITKKFLKELGFKDSKAGDDLIYYIKTGGSLDLGISYFYLKLNYKCKSKKELIQCLYRAIKDYCGLYQYKVVFVDRDGNEV